MGSLYFDLNCMSIDAPSVADGMAKWNEKGKFWEKNLDKWFAPPLPTADERKILGKATRVLNIKAVNTAGYVGIYEETTGDEIFRRRNLSFCLFNPPKAICGDGVAGYLQEGHKGDLTQQALKIISSIEFLPDAPDTPHSGAIHGADAGVPSAKD